MGEPGTVAASEVTTKYAGGDWPYELNAVMLTV